MTNPMNDIDLYRLHEGSIAAPEGFADRTTNLFVLTNEQGVAQSLSIARDITLPDEALEAYVTRQLEIFKQKTTGFELHQRAASRLGDGERAIAGEQIDCHFKLNGRKVSQRQAAFLVAERRVLLFCASLASPPDQAFETLWTKWLTSYVPRAEELPPAPKTAPAQPSPTTRKNQKHTRK